MPHPDGLAEPVAPGGRPHIPALDGVRGLAILAVMLHHFATGMKAGHPAFRPFVRLAEAGWVGVDLFFVLSGFLITGILFDAKGTSHFYRNFYARRFVRIFPLYYATLALYFLPILGPFGSPGDGRGSSLWTRLYGAETGISPLWYWLYASNILLGLKNQWMPLGNYWTLAVEEHFYLLWPFAVGRLDRVRLMWLAAGLFAVALGLRLGMIVVLRSKVSQLALYTWTPCRMDSLAAGAFLALAARGPGGIGALVGPAKWALALASLPLAAFVMRMGTLYSTTLDTLSIGLSLVAVAFAGFLTLAVAAPAGGVFGRFLAWRPLRSLGKYSYGLYVIHASLWTYLPHWLPGYAAEIRTAPEFLGALGYIVLAGAVCYALAWTSWHVLERPFLTLKRHFPEGPSTSCPTPTSPAS